MTKFEISAGARLATVGLLVLVLIMGVANLWASYRINEDSIASQKQQGQVVERKLCLTLDRLAALKPPPGNAANNPSRAYLQDEHDVLAQLGLDIGCR